MTSARHLIYLRIAGVIGIGVGVVGTVWLMVAMAHGVSGAPVIGLALGSLGAVLSGGSNLATYRTYGNVRQQP